MKALLDLVLPVACVGCGARSVVACHACLSPLRVPATPAWPRPTPPGLPPPVSIAAYDGPVREMLLAVKEHGIAALQRPLGQALARAVVAAAPAGCDVPVSLVPVPSSRAARRRRGEDVVRRLAAVAATDLRRAGRVAAVVPALRHARAVSDSAGLGAADRARNLAGAFVVDPRAASRLCRGVVVLVDDLITTGVTLAECSAALAAAGTRPVACATIAATQRRSPPGSAQPGVWALPSQEQVPPIDGRDPAWTLL
jgi:predicted amidophosphoribosyltransferase